MAVKDEVQSGVFKSAGSAVWAILAFLLAVGGAIMAYFVFGDEISAGITFTQQVERTTEIAIQNQDDLRVLKQGAANLELRENSLEAQLEGFIARLERVELESAGREEKIDDAITDFEKRIVVVEDEVGDLAGDVARLSSQVTINTDWRDDQEKRAATRIEKQEQRDNFINKLRADDEDLYRERLPQIESDIRILEGRVP